MAETFGVGGGFSYAGPGDIAKHKARIRRSSGGGGSSGGPTAASRALAARKAAEKKAAKAAAEKIAAEKKAMEVAAAKEQARITKLNRDLMAAGARRTRKESRDIKTGNKQIIVTTQMGSNKIVKVTDTVTGVTRYNTYGTGRGGGGVRQTGGLEVGGQSRSDVIKIESDLRNSGLRPIRNNQGQVVGFRSPDTQKTYRYTDGGIAQFNKDAQGTGAQFRREVRVGKENRMSIKPAERKGVLKLVDEYTRDVDAAKNAVVKSGRNKDIKKLADLQSIKNPTAAEKAERARLTKIVSRNYRRVGEIFTKTIFISLVNLGYGTKVLAQQLREDPILTLRTLPPAILEGLKQDWGRVRSGSPLELTQVFVEYAALGAALKGVGKVAKGSLRILSKLNPRYVRFVNGKAVVRGAKGLVLKEATVKSGAKSLSKQTKFAGKTVTAVNTAADRITSLIRRKKIIRKPIPGEAKFPSKIKASLRKFDEGKKLSTKEFAEVNAYLQKNVAPNITLLERSLYADPASGLRISRLGIDSKSTASLKDILKGNFRVSLKSNRPQVLIFQNAKVAKFPRNLLDVKKKLVAGKKLTTAETNRLIRWQVKSGSGKFKPIGSTIYNAGKELEITLAPGEMIKRIKQVGFTYVKGKKVTFVTAEVFKPTKALLKQIKMANLGKLTKVKLTKLEALLSKKLGRKIKVETPSMRKIVARSGRRSTLPVIRVRGTGLYVAAFRRTVRRKTTRRRPTARRTTRRKPVKRRTGKRTTRKRVTSRRPAKRRPTPKRPARPGRPVRRTPKRPVRRPPKRPPRRPPKRPPKKPPVILRLPKGYTSKTLPKARQTYYVVTRKRGKNVKLFPRPLTRQDAKDFLAYSIDHNLTKTAWFVPLGKMRKVIRPPRNIQGYYNKVSKKLRPYQIRYGKKKQIRRGYIEKRKYFQDTKMEVAQAARLRAKKRKVVKRRTPTKRRVVKRRKVVKRKAPVRRRPAKRRVVRRRVSRKKRK